MSETAANTGAFEDFFSRIMAAIGKMTDEEIALTMTKEKKTIAVAESLTGGMICEHLSSVPGSSEFFIGGIVCYSNRLKVMELGVPASVIAKEGPVSKEVAVAMAESIRKRYKTDLGLSATGIAGPGTGNPPRPLGLTYIAISSQDGNDSKELNLTGSRKEIREKAAQAALGLLWLNLTGQEL